MNLQWHFLLLRFRLTLCYNKLVQFLTIFANHNSCWWVPEWLLTIYLPSQSHQPLGLSLYQTWASWGTDSRFIGKASLWATISKVRWAWVKKYILFTDRYNTEDYGTFTGVIYSFGGSTSCSSHIIIILVPTIFLCSIVHVGALIIVIRQAEN